MSNVTVTVPEDLKHKMDKFDDINWSAVARKAFQDKIQRLILLEELASKSKLTEGDALRLGKKVNKAMWKKHYEKLVG